MLLRKRACPYSIFSHSGVRNRLIISTADRQAAKVLLQEGGFLYSQQPYRNHRRNSLRVKPGKNPPLGRRK